MLHELRDCEADGSKGKFHLWEQYSEIVPPSIMVGGHDGGTVAGVYAIVELSDGKVIRCEPNKIVFTDTRQKESGTKSKSKAVTLTEEKMECPHCGTGNDNAVIYMDDENKEFFVYCMTCGIETTETYKGKKQAVKAFKEGKTKSIYDRGAYAKEGTE